MVAPGAHYKPFVHARRARRVMREFTAREHTRQGANTRTHAHSHARCDAISHDFMRHCHKSSPATGNIPPVPDVRLPTRTSSPDNHSTSSSSFPLFASCLMVFPDGNRCGFFLLYLVKRYSPETPVLWMTVIFSCRERRNGRT